MNLQERLRQYIEYKGVTTQEFEKMADLSNGAVSKMGDNTRTSTLDKISNSFPDLNINWLRMGIGNMLITPAQKPTPKNVVEVEELPLIPISALAGALSGSDMSFMEYECERYIVPIFKDADFLIRLQGDSMMPKYVSGDIVACQRVPLDRLWFQWGKTYVIDTRQGALVKRIEPSDKEGFISIHSENPLYKPFDLPTEEVNGVALVKGIIRVE